MQKAQLTVLLATKNGERVLPRTLAGYCRLSAAPVGWKMVIVDNGSTDATLQILDSFQKDLPLEVLRQPIAGKSRALNTGLSAVEGRLVVLTDDDAIPDPLFLEAWAQFLDSRGDFGLFGGSIEPWFEIPPPEWLTESKLAFAMMFAERTLSEGPIAADQIYGPNMAVRKAIFDLGFRYDEEMSPNGLEDYLMGEETELCQRVARAGFRCWFARRPLVRHIVRPDQLTADAWARRAYRCGRGRAYYMWKTGEIIAPPKVSIADRLACLSPLPRHKFSSICARYIARGFRDEWVSRLAMVENGR